MPVAGGFGQTDCEAPPVGGDAGQIDCEDCAGLVAGGAGQAVCDG
ncbi:MAG: hypothetical protein WBF58_15025 [Xanthobacteraceae bacterium]